MPVSLYHQKRASNNNNLKFTYIMSIAQLEAVECIKNIQNRIDAINKTMAAKNTFQPKYLLNCKKDIEACELQISNIRKQFSVN